MKKVSSGNNDITANIHIDDVEKYTEESILKALEMIGLKAESYAKMKCLVDTGLLRNSIAHAVAGEVPSIGANYKGTSKNARKYKANDTDKRGNPVEKVRNKEGKEELPNGSYTRRTPRKNGEYKVYIGTNVYYAPYVEMGHRQNVGQFVKKLGRRLVKPHIEAHPFIRPAILEHIDEWEEIFAMCLREALDDSNQNSN